MQESQSQPLQSQEPQPPQQDQPRDESTGIIQQNTSQPQPPFAEQKKELFRREEVRTMRKDLARILEEEAQKERERISQLKTAEEIKKEQERIARLKKEEEERMFAVKEEMMRARIATQAEELKAKAAQAAQEQLLAKEAQKEKVVPKPAYKLPFPLPPKPSLIDKLFSRWLAIGIMVAFLGVVITFWYWYFFVRQKSEQPPPPPPSQQETPAPQTPPQEQPPATPEGQPQQEIPPTEEQPQPPSVPQAPESFIPMDQTATIEFSSEEEFPVLFSEAVQRYRGEDVFTSLIAHNISANTVLTLSDFFRIFNIKTPEGFLEKLSPNVTLFVYSSLIANRFGFAAPITDQANFEGIMRSWEPTMEKDTENLFSLLGKKEPSATQKFKQAVYKNTVFRYLSFPSINFGIVWSILSREDPQTQTVKYYLVLTSSGESMLRIIDRFSR